MPATAIITRTKDRGVLLQRALRSVEGQTLRDFCWVLVNDGGNHRLVDEAAATARKAGIDCHVIHRANSSGMEAAANHGLRESDSKYVAIHDDDDSWDPDFLAVMTGFLDANPHYLGAVCHTMKIEERIGGERIKTLRKKTMNADLEQVHISELFYRNLFPPVSLVYRREVLDKIGYYDESLPVLGDWDFNLRLIMEGDIAVIPRPLAFYHTRPAAKLGAAANSIHGNPNLHKQYEAVIRNRFIRNAVKSDALSAGLLMAITSSGRRPRGIARNSWLKL
jgi:glycosyltransferase involved in cell wall biosynthesis